MADPTNVTLLSNNVAILKDNITQFWTLINGIIIVCIHHYSSCFYLVVVLKHFNSFATGSFITDLFDYITDKSYCCLSVVS